MLDTLELLLPIPTGAKMERWRKMVIQRGKKDEVKTGETQKCTRDIFVHHVHSELCGVCYEATFIQQTYQNRLAPT